jgi:hypothetical protein
MQNYAIAISCLFLVIWELRQGRLQLFVDAIDGSVIISGTRNASSSSSATTTSSSTTSGNTTININTGTTTA